MSKLNTKTTLHFEATLTVTEAELRALDGILGYDVDHFLKVFYEKMGSAYVKPHESGVRSLHSNLRAQLSGPIAEIDDIRFRLNQK